MRQKDSRERNTRTWGSRLASVRVTLYVCMYVCMYAVSFRGRVSAGAAHCAVHVQRLSTRHPPPRPRCADIRTCLHAGYRHCCLLGTFLLSILFLHIQSSRHNETQASKSCRLASCSFSYWFIGFPPHSSFLNSLSFS